MGIKIYNDGEHGGGFIGIRVYRMVGHQLRQKYLSYRTRKFGRTFCTESEARRLLEIAERLDQQWAREQKERARIRQLECLFNDHPNSIEKTGITGIRPVIICETRYDRPRKDNGYYRYYALGFRVCYNSRAKVFIITGNHYKIAWARAVAFYKAQVKIPRSTYLNLLAAMPDPMVFGEIRVRKIKAAHNIPAQILKL